MPTTIEPLDQRSDRDARTAQRPGFELTGRHVLAMFVGFFIVVAAVNAYMMTQALRTMPGLEARNGYDVSQRFNGEIRAAQVQTQRGWTVDAIVDRAWVDVSFRDAGQRGLGDLAVEVRLVNPTDRSLDRIVGLETERTGRYVASIAPLKPGTWDITITAVKDGERVFLSRHRKTIKA